MQLNFNHIYPGDTLIVLKTFPDDYFDTIITSPPYWGLRDYGVKGQIGLEKTLLEYIEKLLSITAELKRVLKPTGVLFWNHGDCYGSHRDWNRSDIALKKQLAGGGKRQAIKGYEKCLMLQNYRLILCMVDDQGWILRNDIKWFKPNHMPSSVKDRFANSYEPVFMLVKQQKYWFDLDAVRQPYTEPLNRWGGPSLKKGTSRTKGYADMQKIGNSSALRVGRNMRPIEAGKNPGDVWKIPTQPYSAAHFATFPEKLIEPMIKSTCPQWICKKCGKARERIIKPTEEYAKRLGKAWHNHKEDGKRGQRYSREIAGVPCSAEYKTVGWTDCGCNAGWTPGVVLDPFMGAGTTALVARSLGRNYIGIELNPEYIKIANQRLEKALGMFK